MESVKRQFHDSSTSCASSYYYISRDSFNRVAISRCVLFISYLLHFLHKQISQLQYERVSEQLRTHAAHMLDYFHKNQFTARARSRLKCKIKLNQNIEIHNNTENFI